jgi:hypothetical protein
MPQLAADLLSEHKRVIQRRMSYVRFNGKTLFLRAIAEKRRDKRPPEPHGTIGFCERFGSLVVSSSGKPVALEPISPESGWWIGFHAIDPKKFRPNKARQAFRYRGEEVVPDYLHLTR